MTSPIKDEWISKDGRIRLLLGNCLEILPTLKIGSVNIVIDPPYGINEKWGCGKGWVSNGINGRGRLWNGTPDWDKEPAWREVQVTLALIHHYAIIWGGNYFDLPPASGWLVWDKMQIHTGSHAELAWSNIPQPIRTFRMSRIDAYVNIGEYKQHPNQKPTRLMSWCLSFIKGDLPILDSMMGSGTTGVACVYEDRRFIGIEIDPTYYEIAKKRIHNAMTDKSRRFQLTSTKKLTTSSLFPIEKNKRPK
jgi:site-specific DNA-methyltransferase (adenine-specific)/modification methylase